MSLGASLATYSLQTFIVYTVLLNAFTPHQHHQMEVGMFCPQCGSRNDLNKKYCRNCGFSLTHTQFVLDGNLDEAIAKIGKSEKAIRRGVKILFTFILIAIFLAVFADPFEITIGPPLESKISIHHWPTFIGLGLVLGGAAILMGLIRLRRVNRLLPPTDQLGQTAISESSQLEDLPSSVSTNKMINANQHSPNSAIEDATLKIKQID